MVTFIAFSTFKITLEFRYVHVCTCSCLPFDVSKTKRIKIIDSPDYNLNVNKLVKLAVIIIIVSNVFYCCYPDATGAAPKTQQQRQRQQLPMVINTPITIPAMTPAPL